MQSLKARKEGGDYLGFDDFVSSVLIHDQPIKEL